MIEDYDREGSQATAETPLIAEITRRADVLIVTALAVERESVRRHLSDVRVVRSGTTTGDLGVFESDGIAVTVAVIETGAGNVHASTATSAALRDLSPETVVVIGIAGGVKDVGIGDVVASRKVYWVEQGRIEAEQTEGGGGRDVARARPEFGPVSQQARPDCERGRCERDVAAGAGLRETQSDSTVSWLVRW